MFRLDVDKNEMTMHDVKIDPCVVHFPGARLRRRKLLKCLSEDMPVKIDSDKLTIVTYSNYLNTPPVVKQFQEDKRFVVFGEEGEKFYPIDKLHRICDYVGKIDTEYFISLDSSDVLFFGNPSEVISRYMDIYEPLGCKMLFNAEISHYPPITPTKVTEKILANRHRYCFLNSGVYISNTEYFARTISDNKEQMMSNCKDLIKVHRGSDQMIFKMFYVKNHPSMIIDSDCKLFQTVPKRLGMELVKDGRARNI